MNLLPVPQFHDDIEHGVEHQVCNEDGQDVRGKVGRPLYHAVHVEANVGQDPDDQQEHAVHIHRPEPVRRTGLEIIPAHQVNPLEDAQICKFIRTHHQPKTNNQELKQRETK